MFETDKAALLLPTIIVKLRFVESNLLVDKVVHRKLGSSALDSVPCFITREKINSLENPIAL